MNRKRDYERKNRTTLQPNQGFAQKNDREYIVAITPEVTYSHPDFTFPEYFNNILGKYGFSKLLCDSIDVDWDDFILDENEEPVYDEDYDEEDCILYYEYTRFVLIAIRIESDKLVFCVETIFTDDEQTVCEDVEEVGINSLENDYADDIVVRALDAYVRILSDTTRDSMCWKI